MCAQILPFRTSTPALATAIGHFIRIGSAHRKLADLHVASGFPATRIVVEASRVDRQNDLIAVMRDAGAEIVLDTEAAKLASLAKFAGHSRRAPWALPPNDGPLGPERFQPHTFDDVLGQIARFAVAKKFDAVFAPAHFISDPSYRDWVKAAHEACIRFRETLDREGGANIAIDYPVIVTHAELNNADIRAELITSLASLPIENVWVRASCLDASPGPLTITRYLNAISHFHNLGKPIFADHLGGLTGLAALAFGTVSGIAHGIIERERFDASDWHKAPPPRADDASFGRAVRISIPGLNRSATLKELELLATAKGGRRMVGCGDPTCRPCGYPEMTNDPRRHVEFQAFKAIDRLEGVPDLRREHFFLNGPMTEADRIGRQLRGLKLPAAEAAKYGINPTELMKRLGDHSRKLEQLLSVFERRHESRGDDSHRARPVKSRSPRRRATREERP